MLSIQPKNFVVWKRVKPMPNNKLLDWTKLKALAYDKLYAA